MRNETNIIYKYLKKKYYNGFKKFAKRKKYELTNK